MSVQPAYSKKSPFDLDLFVTLADQSPSGIFIWKINGKKEANQCTHVFVNQRAAKMMGIKAKSFLDQSVADTFPGLEKTKFLLAYAAALKTRKMQRILSFEYSNGKASKKHFRIDLIPLDKKYLGVFFVDTTTQNKVQEELKEKMEEMQRMNKLMVGREMKMIELKEEIAQLKKS